MNNEPITRLIDLTDDEIACNLICDMIVDSADNDAIYIEGAALETLRPETIAALTDAYPLLTLDDDNLDAIAAAFNDPTFSLHAAHIRDTMRDCC